MYYNIVSVFVWCPCMAINESVEYNGRLLPDSILLAQSHHHRGIRLNVMKRFSIWQPVIPPNKRFDIFRPDWGMLRRSRRVHIFL